MPHNTQEPQGPGPFFNFGDGTVARGRETPAQPPIKHGQFVSPIDPQLDKLRQQELRALESIGQFENLFGVEHDTAIEWLGKLITVKNKKSHKSIQLKITGINRINGTLNFDDNQTLTFEEFSRKYEKMDSPS